MKGLFSRTRFAGFGPSRLLPPSHLPELVRIRARSAVRLRQLVREQAPRRPGVYGMLDARGVLIYVGKAKCLRTRLLSYFRPNGDPKAGRIVEQTRTLVWEPAPGEFAALLRELELIRRFLPKFNVRGVPGLQRVSYVCLGRPPAPTAFVAREPTGTELACYGPLPGIGRARDAIRWLDDAFQLRDCPRRQPLHFAEQGELFPAPRPPGCLRYEIGTCSGPCLGAVTRAAYGAQVRAAKRFLDGHDRRLLPELERAMQTAAAAQNFEYAATLRDRLGDLSWLSERLAWLRTTREHGSFVYPMAGPDGSGSGWYLIHRGRVWAAVDWPTNPVRQRAAATAIEKVYPPHESAGPLPADEIDHILIVSAWFKQRPDEKARLLSPAAALAQCRSTAGSVGLLAS